MTNNNELEDSSLDNLTKETKKFSDYLADLKNPESNHLNKNELLMSPFQKELTIQVEKMPDMVAIADPHIIASQSSLEKIDGLASYKRRMLGEVKQIRQRIRLIDVISRFSLREAIKEGEKYLGENSLFVILGDTIMSTEAGNVFSSFSSLEKTLHNLNNNLEKNNQENHSLSILNLVGNHYSFTGAEKEDYKHMAKIYPTLSQEVFEEIVAEIENGCSWDSINQAWNQYRNQFTNPQFSLHPLQKWYLEKLTFGSQVGRYVSSEKSENFYTNSQAVFLDNLMVKGGTQEDLYTALNELDIKSESPLYSKIIACHEKEETSQKELMKTMLEDRLNGMKTVVYTHWPELMQEKIIEYAQKEFGWSEITSRSLIESLLEIWGGHRHLAERDLVKKRRGVVWVSAITRELVSALVQQPVDFSKKLFLPFTLKEPFHHQEIDSPELIIGKADRPQKIRVEKIMAKFNSLLAAIQNK